MSKAAGVRPPQRLHSSAEHGRDRFTVLVLCSSEYLRAPKSLCNENDFMDFWNEDSGLQARSVRVS